MLKLDDILKYVKKNKSTILSTVASLGVIGTEIFSVRAGKKISEKCNEDVYILPRKEKAKVYIKHLVLPTAISMGTIFCIFKSDLLYKKELTKMAGAYAILNGTYHKYKNEVIERYGNDMHRDILKSISDSGKLTRCESDWHISSCCYGNATTLDFEDDEETRLFYDVFSDRYFESKTSKVLQAQYAINRNLILRGYATLSEFYNFLGIEPTEESELLGWVCCGDYYWIDFNNYKMYLEDGAPMLKDEKSHDSLECNCIEFMVDPVLDYEES